MNTLYLLDGESKITDNLWHLIRFNVLLDITFQTGLHMLLQTSIYSSVLKITASNFQEMLLRDSTLQRQHKLDFDEHNHNVPFVISWPNYSNCRCSLKTCANQVVRLRRLISTIFCQHLMRIFLCATHIRQKHVSEEKEHLSLYTKYSIIT